MNFCSQCASRYGILIVGEPCKVNRSMNDIVKEADVSESYPMFFRINADMMTPFAIVSSALTVAPVFAHMIMAAQNEHLFAWRFPFLISGTSECRYRALLHYQRWFAVYVPKHINDV